MKVGLSPCQQAHRFPDTLAEARAAEALGYDSVWIHEHHGVPEGHYPSPLVMLAAIAAAVPRVAVGTSVLLLPFRHPLQVAEDAAVVDVISGGRLILGLGVGYRQEEFAHFGVQRAERGRRFDEGLRLLLRAWAGEGGPYTGECFRGEALRIFPRPVQQPRPPIWVGGWAEAALRRAAELGDAWLPGPTGDLPTVARAFERYACFVEAAGGRVEARERPLMRELFVATDRGVREEAEAALARMYRERYVQWGLGTVQTAGAGFAALARDRFIVGGPDEVLQEIERYRRAVGVTHLMCRMHFPGLRPKAVLASMRLFAQHVLPALRRG